MNRQEYQENVIQIVDFVDAAINKSLEELDLDDIDNIPDNESLFQFIKPYAGEKEYQQMAFLANHLIEDHNVPVEKLIKDIFDVIFQREMAILQHKYIQNINDTREKSDVLEPDAED